MKNCVLSVLGSTVDVRSCGFRWSSTCISHIFYVKTDSRTLERSLTGTVPLRAHRWHVLFVKLHCVPSHGGFVGFKCVARDIDAVPPRFHVLTASRGANIDHGVLAVGDVL